MYRLNKRKKLSTKVDCDVNFNSVIVLEQCAAEIEWRLCDKVTQAFDELGKYFLTFNLHVNV